MKLLTEELKKQLPPLYSQQNEKDPLVVCKFFHPLSFWTWYAIEGSPVDEDGYYDTDKDKVDFLFFGWVYGDFPELGYFSLSEMEQIKVGGLGMERDLHFTPLRLSEVKKEHYAKLPLTRTVHTASGGLHYYFQYPDDGKTYQNAVGLADQIGVDVRADGGYVVLPPSKLFGRLTYSWTHYDTPLSPLPDWLNNLLPTKGEQQEYPHDLRFACPSGEKWLTEAVSSATEGNRNAIGFWLACQLRDDRLTQNQATRIILLYANRVPQEKSPYTSQEAVKSIRSAFSRVPRPPAERQNQ